MIPYSLEHYIIDAIFTGRKASYDDSTFYLNHDRQEFRRYTDMKPNIDSIRFYWNVNMFQQNYNLYETLSEKLTAPLLVITYEGERYSDWLIDQNAVIQLC
jgi:hypothetical protein